MLSEKLLTAKQQAAASRLYGHDRTILVAATGAGKTAICLTAIAELIEEGHLSSVIVGCPAKVVSTKVWSNEAAKWEHTAHLDVVELVGDPSQRLALMEKGADVYVVSLNNLKWAMMQDHGCEGVIVDELSKAGGKQGQCLKSRAFAKNLTWRVGMTATPVSQDFEKLYGMCRIIDEGKALGTNKHRYMEKYFYSDYMGYNWTLRDDGAEQIMAAVAPLIHMVEDTKEADLPPLHEHVIRFDMPEATRVVYNDMKRHMVAGDVEAANEAVKSGKLRQIASGFMYDDEDTATVLDYARMGALHKWAETLMGEPGLVFYEFKYQGTWCGPVPSDLTFAQINSMSHGVDGLQHEFADVLFIQPVWSRDATEQAIGRVWRQGQTRPVNVTTLVCNDTLDDLVVSRVEDRGEWMKIFKAHLEG